MKRDPLAPSRPITTGCLLACLGLAAILLPQPAQAQGEGVPGFSKTFSPATIGPGSVSTLTFTITNNDSVGVRGLEFVDTLPAGMVIASPANASTDCEGALIAPPGGTVISLIDGRVSANGSCTVSVDVTAAGPGAYANVSGDLTSDAGNSGAAEANLVVSEGLPGFSKSFEPAFVGIGQRSTLTFTIDNSANEGPRNNPSFTDILPIGMVIADPPNATTDCPNAVVDAVAGGNTISLSPQGFPASTIPAFSTCTVSVDVVASAVGVLHNISGELTSSIGFGAPTSSGKASASLRVSSGEISITKTFTDDPAPAGGTATLQFTITNNSRDGVAREIRFTDDLGAMFSGLAAVGLPLADPCGPGSSLKGTTVISLDGGTLAPGASCTFDVTLQLPAEMKAGTYINTTSSLRAVVGETEIEAAPASADLFVAPVPVLTKRFLDDPVVPGATARLEVTITNTSQTSSASNIAFDDPLPLGISGVSQFQANDVCGEGSTLTFTPGTNPPQAPSTPPTLSLSGGFLEPGQSCTFQVTVDIDPGAATSIAVNTTSPITANVNDTVVTGRPATDQIAIIAAPQLSKRFVDNPAAPGDTVRLEFTLSHSPEASVDALDISFEDNLDAMIPGLVAVGLPLTNVCGPGSAVAGTSTISLRGGSLKPGEVCVFTVNVAIPEQAALGVFTNTTGSVTAAIAGLKTASDPATADLQLTTLALEKRFLTDPVIPGETTTLQFTITNSGPVAATDIRFDDNLNGMIPGTVVASDNQSGICGPSSTLNTVGTNTLQLRGGSLAAESSCTFSVDVTIPASTPDGTYLNTTSSQFATVGNSPLALAPAADTLTVAVTLLDFSKAFLVGPVNPGGTTTLEFTITNLDSTSAATDIAFTDTLPSGLAMTGGTLTGICGAGSSVSGTTTITFAGGTLAAGASCTFSVPVEVSPNAGAGTLENVTGEVTGVIRNFAVRGEPASASLAVELPPPPGGPFGVNDVSRPGDGTTVLELNTVVGRRYCIEWSDDLITWTTVPTPIVGEVDPVTWIDAGPPELPTSGDMRFYRLREKTGEE